MAFVLFRKAAPDVTVLEAGLGGRSDATNVLSDVLVSVVTRIGLDHCDWLGSTYAEIAGQKAGILHPGRPVVCGAMPESARETVARFASLDGCPFTAADEHVAVERISPLVLTTPIRNPPPIALALEGAYQVENAMTALTAIDVLCKDWGFHVSDMAVRAGFEQVVWPGRFQRVVRDGVTFIVDGAHNPDGAMALRDSLRIAHLNVPIAFVCGFCGDKDVLANLRVLSALSTEGWAVPLSNMRSLEPAKVAERMALAGFVSAEACATLEDGLKRATDWAKRTGGVPVVCGSLFLAGEALLALDAFPWPIRPPDANEMFPGHVS
jgi:dihydrofolate synthase/folylpolyglutamate synthase